jgi:hypothetical protein
MQSPRGELGGPFSERTKSYGGWRFDALLSEDFQSAFELGLGRRWGCWRLAASRIFVERTQFCQFGVVGDLFKDADSQFRYLFANGAGSLLPLRCTRLILRYFSHWSTVQDLNLLCEKSDVRMPAPLTSCCLITPLRPTHPRRRSA